MGIDIRDEEERSERERGEDSGCAKGTPPPAIQPAGVRAYV